MTDYSIHLLHTGIHKFTGLQLRFGNESQAFRQGESIPRESLLDISIESTLLITQEDRYLQTHFQVDDIHLPEDEIHPGYRLQFCLLAIFAVKNSESEATVKQFTQTHLPNLLAPIVSDNHYRFVSILQPGSVITRLQPYIPPETIQNFIEQNKITFEVAA